MIHSYLIYFQSRLIQNLLFEISLRLAYNLSAIRAQDAMVKLHLLDSLAILPWIRPQRVLDLGSGAGLPGIVLALADPSLELVLLDSNGKKIRFLREVQRALSLSNVEIIHARAEEHRPSLGFDTIVSRAFSEISQMITWSLHLLAADGIWLAMKGKCPLKELNKLHYHHEIHSYTIDSAERCCVVIQKNLNHSLM